MNESLFNYGDIVRLKKTLKNTNLQVGDYGIIWAVYSSYIDENKAVLEFDYEGTFENKEGNIVDSMFDEEDIEKVLEIKHAPFSKSMKKLWLYINGKEK